MFAACSRRRLERVQHFRAPKLKLLQRAVVLDAHLVFHCGEQFLAAANLSLGSDAITLILVRCGQE